MSSELKVLLSDQDETVLLQEEIRQVGIQEEEEEDKMILVVQVTGGVPRVADHRMVMEMMATMMTRRKRFVR